MQTADPFVQDAISFSKTWDPILKKLEAFQSVGSYLSKVSLLSGLCILYIPQPTM